jgi:rSAM/selenodomain-associated transferase 2
VIVPTLNEAQNLPRALSVIQNTANAEIIVVDGGSEDETVSIAKAHHANVIPVSPGRAGQMNCGAAAATGDILLFLHADTCLPDRWDYWIRQTLAQPGVVAGAFGLQIDAQSLELRLVEWGVNVRSRLFQFPYGDQAIFLRAQVFHDQGGFPDLPIMEDFELIRQLRRRGRVAIPPAAVTTSGRRWQKLGVLRTTLINQLIIAGYFAGVAPPKLMSWYRPWGKSP